MKDLIDFCLGHHHLPITIQVSKKEKEKRINNIVNIYYKLVKQ
jgi:hypothetical protein